MTNFKCVVRQVCQRGWGWHTLGLDPGPKKNNGGDIKKSLSVQAMTFSPNLLVILELIQSPKSYPNFSFFCMTLTWKFYEAEFRLTCR